MNNPGFDLEKLRKKQLLESLSIRLQMIENEISYEGVSSHHVVRPLFSGAEYKEIIRLARDRVRDELRKDHRISEKCPYCDSCGGAKTYEHQAPIPINGRVRCIDFCIAPIVAALNAGGVKTVASCCGHLEREGRIDLADGRVLRIERP